MKFVVFVYFTKIRSPKKRGMTAGHTPTFVFLFIQVTLPFEYYLSLKEAISFQEIALLC